MSWWNPVSWWNDASNAAGSIVSQIKTWVLDIVRSAINLVENDIGDVFHWASETATLIFGFAQRVYNDAYNWYTDAVGYAFKVYNDVLGYIYQVYRDIIGWASNAISTVETLIYHIWASVIGTIEQYYNDAIGFAGQVYKDVIGYAQQLYNTLSGYIGQVYRDLIGWVEQTISAAINYVYGIVKRDLFDPFIPFWDVIKEAWDWIAYFAGHPLALVHDVEHGVLDWSRQLPGDIGNELASSRGRDIVDEVVAWLG